MSQDAQLTWLCPHNIRDVVMTPEDSTGEAFSVVYPVVSRLEVWIAGKAVPPGGLLSQAQLTSMHAGPYFVKYPFDLKIRLPSESVPSVEYSVKFLARNYTAEQLAAKFVGIPGLTCSATPDGRIMMQETQNQGARSFIHLSGLYRTDLALPTGAVGRDVYPSWGLLKGTQGLPDQVVFSRPLQTQTSLIKAHYKTHQDYCPRCQSTLVENDTRLQDTGDIKTVRGYDLLYQICLKAILTEVGSNPYFPAYGSSVMNSIGEKALTGVEYRIQESVRRALQVVQNVQAQQCRSQIVTAEEKLAEIKMVRGTRDPNDPTVINVEVTVVSASRTPVKLTMTFTVPGAHSLGEIRAQ